jgi:hypothetical protein
MKQQQQQQQQQYQPVLQNKPQHGLQQKAEEINLVLLQPDVDLWKLRELAFSEGGLVNGTSFCFFVLYLYLYLYWKKGRKKEREETNKKGFYVLYRIIFNKQHSSLHTL